MKPHILYEDQDIIVCLKPAGIPTQTSRPGLPDMVSILKNHIYQNSAHKKQPYLAVIHRLACICQNTCRCQRAEPSAPEFWLRQILSGGSSRMPTDC